MNTIIINGTRVIENSTAHNWLTLDHEYDHLTYSTHKEIIDIICYEVGNDGCNGYNKELHMDIIDILAYIEYPLKYILKVSYILEKYMEDISNGFPIESIPVYEKLTQSTEIKMKKGIALLENYNRYVKDNNNKVADSSPRKSTSIRAKVKVNDRTTDVTITGIGWEKSNVIFDNEDIDFSNVSNDLLYIEDKCVAVLIESLRPKEDQEEESTLAMHDSMGLVKIIAHLRNEYGREVIEVQPIISNPFINGTNSVHSYDNPTSISSQKPTIVYPCELVTMENIRPAIRNKIEEILNDSNNYKQYSCFSMSDNVCSAITRDLNTTNASSITCYDTLSALEENIIPLIDLPKEKIHINSRVAYQVKILKEYQKSYKMATKDGKLDRTKLTLPKIPKSSIEIKQLSEPVIINDMIVYNADINDNIQVLKTKTSNGSWKIKTLSPKVLVFCVDTLKIKTVNASMLHVTNCPTSQNVTVNKYKQVKPFPTKMPTGDTPQQKEKFNEILTQCFTLKESKSLELNLSRSVEDDKVNYQSPKHKRFYDIAISIKDLKYVHTDPMTKEKTVDTSYVYENSLELAEETGYPFDLITATRNSKQSFSAKDAHIAECVRNIKKLEGVSAVEYKKKGKLNSDKQQLEVTITKNNINHKITVVKKESQFEVLQNISTVAKKLLSEFATVIFTPSKTFNEL